MEAKLLTRRRGRCGIRSWLPAALLLVHCAISGAVRAQSAAGVDVIEVYALGSDPRPLALAAERSKDEIIVRATVRFANECLARAGFDPISRDLAPLALTGTRLLLLHARRVPEGCPDMYAPVERTSLMRISAAREVRQVVLLDEMAGRHPAVVAVASSSSDSTTGNVIRPAGALLPVSAIEMTPARDLRLRIGLPNGCSSRDIALEVVEGRSVTGSGQSVTSVPLWVLVLADSAACQTGVTDLTVDARASLRSLILQGRELWLVNPLLPPGGAEPRLFTRLWPG